MTPEQYRGNQFEIFLEELLRKDNHSPFRNVYFMKNPRCYRQVDLFYGHPEKNIVKYCMIEAKYSSNGRVKNKIRKHKKKNEQTTPILDTIVRETHERYSFIHSKIHRIDYVYLVTNSYFEQEVLQEAKYLGINIVQKDTLTRMHGKSIDRSILDVDVSRYNLKPCRIYSTKA